ncbi:MAG: Ig-like domain-containing protein [bacterium]
METNMGGGQIGNIANEQSPIIIRVLPQYGDVAGGTELSVTGAYFANGDKLYVGDKECLNTQFISSSEIKCTSPSATAGLYGLKVENSNSNNYTLTNAYEYIVTSLKITGPNNGNNFSTSKQDQTIHGTCSKNIKTLYSNLGTFFDEDCSDGTWSLDVYSLSLGNNVFEISGESDDGKVSSDDTITINYSDIIASINISEPNSGNNFSTNIQSQTLSGTCSIQITNLNTTLGTFLDNDCSDGTWSLKPFSLLSGSNEFVISGLDTLGTEVTDSISITYDTTPPLLAITGPNSGTNFVTDGLVQTISGTCGTDVVIMTTSLGNFADNNCVDGTWSLNPYVLSSGANTFTITAQDTAGNISTASITITYDNNTYSISITSPNNGTNFSTNVRSQTLSGSCTSGLTNLTTTLGSVFDSDCSNGTWNLNAYQLSAGTNTFTISALDPVGNTVSNTLVINYDTTAPSVNITAPNNGNNFTTASMIQTISGTCGHDVVGISTSLGNFSDNNCSDGIWSLNPYILSTGLNTFTITAYDAAGNSSTASLTITYDNNTYTIHVTSPNDGTNFYTKVQNQTISGNCSIGITDLTSNLGTFSDSDCSDGTWSLQATLSTGSNNFQISGKDPLSRTISSFISINYDTVPPTVNILSPNAGINFTTDTIVQTISGTCSSDVFSITTSLGNFADNNCSDGTWTLNPFVLSPGDNVFTITAQDSAGNAASSSITINYDNSTYSLQVTAPNNGTPYITNTASQIISGTCSVGLNNLTTSLGSFTDSDCSDGTWSLASYSLSTGTNEFVISGRDPVNNIVSDSMTITYDHLAPVINISSPNAGIDLVTDTMIQTVSGNCGTDVVNLTSSLGNFADLNCADGTWSLNPYILSAGNNIFTITAYDAAGNTSIASILINYHNIPSTIHITAPNNGSSFTINNQSQTISGTCSTDITALSTNVGTFTDDDCSDGTWSLNSISLSTGANVINISGTDPVGNNISTSMTITYDGLAPTLSIAAPNAGINFTTDSLVQTISGLCDTDIVSLTTSRGTFADNNCIDGTWSLNPYVLNTGTNTFIITAYDSAGNSAISTMTITYDSSTYTIAVTSPNSGQSFSTNVQAQTLSGTCSIGVTNLSTNLGTFSDSNCSDGTWSMASYSLASGVNNFTISGKNPSGKTVSTSVSINYDTTAPTIAITAPNSGNNLITNQQLQTISGTCSTDVTSLTSSEGSFLDSSCSDGTWSLNPYILSPGSNIFTITAHDSAGNTASSSITVTYDTNVYSLFINAPHSGSNFSTNIQSQTLSGTCSVGVTTLTTNLGTFTDSNCSDGTWALNLFALSSGVNNFTISGKDPLGNTVSSSISINYDTLAPALSITSPNSGTNFTTTTIVQTVSGSCGTDVTTITTSLGTFADNNCSDGTWSLNAMVLNVGTNTFTITASDAAGNTSINSIVITYDDNLPEPSSPIVSSTSPTTNKKPSWSWYSGGGGMGTYKYKLDSLDFSSGATETSSTSYTPVVDLSIGTHTLYIKEKNSNNIWSQVSSFSVVIQSCNPVVVWGRNNYGQLGTNTTSFQTTPTDLPGLTNITKVVPSGMGSTMVLKSDKTLWGWGTNDYGELGDGTTTTKSSPTRVLLLDNVDDFEIGSAHSIALKHDGTVWVWGYGGVGQIGNGTNVTSFMPIELYGVAPFTSGIITKIAVGVGNSFTSGTSTAVVRNDGTVWTWGGGTSGQLGNNANSNNNNPVQVLGVGGSGFLTDVKDVKVGSSNMVALKNDGTVWAWGYNNFGQVGNNSTTNTSTPVQVVTASGALTGITVISAGLSHNLAIRGSDGSVWAWGYNNAGQLGDATTVNKLVATQVKGPDTGGFLLNVSKVSAGYTHSLAIKTDGTVWGWGSNALYQVGDGTLTNRTQPVQITSLSNNIAVDIRAAAEHSVVLTTSNTIKVWGANFYGQMNMGVINQIAPTSLSSVGGYDNTPASSISGGTSNSLMVRSSDSSVWAWGQNNYGQTGDNATGNPYTRTSPIQTKDLGGSGVLTGVSSVSSGNAHSLAIKNGQVYAWGYNVYGRLGDNTTSTRYYPVKVVDLTPGQTYLSNITAVEAANQHSIALKNDGTVWAWGSNGNGQVGINTATSSYNYTNEVLLLGSASPLSNITAISSCNGSNHSLALKNDYTVWAWGYNSSGQLGDGTTNLRYQPIQVLGLTDVIAISAGNYHSLALKSDGTVWAWGQNNYGQIGDNTLGYNRAFPTQVYGLTHVTKINAGDSHNIAVINCSY